ncbi:MAG: phosphodiesterase [Alphaproteobacteria bacterium]
MRIVQLSDLHVRPRGDVAYGRVDPAPMLEAAVARILSLSPRPDLVLATGDLTDRGLREEYGLLGAILSRLPMRVLLLPGNHDRREEMRGALRALDATIPASGPMHRAIDEGGLRLVLLDSVIDGETDGELGAAGIAWLEAALRAGEGRPALVAIHHAPFDVGIAGMDAIGLRDGEAMGAAIARHPEVEIVACGHHHRPMVRRWRGTTGFVAPSTVHQVHLDLAAGARTRFAMEPPGFALHDWAPGRGLVTHVVPVEDGGGAFDFELDPAYPGKGSERT